MLDKIFKLFFKKGSHYEELVFEFRSTLYNYNDNTQF